MSPVSSEPSSSQMRSQPSAPGRADEAEPSLWRRRVLDPLMGFLRQGLTPRELAFTVALGLALGIIPALGITTLLCFVVAVLLRLNVAALQLVNYLVYPLQLILFLPFLRAGSWLFDSRPVRLEPSELVDWVQRDALGAMQALGWVTLRGVVAWGLVAPVIVILGTLVLTPMLRVAHARLGSGLGSRGGEP